MQEENSLFIKEYFQLFEKLTSTLNDNFTKGFNSLAINFISTLNNSKNYEHLLINNGLFCNLKNKNTETINK